MSQVNSIEVQIILPGLHGNSLLKMNPDNSPYFIQDTEETYAMK